MSVDAGTIYSGVRVKLDALNRDVKAVQAEFDKIGGAVRGADKAVKDTSSSFLKLAGTFATGQLAAQGLSKAMGAVVDFTKKAITASIDAQETFGKYDEVFKGMGEQSEEAAQRFAKAFDLAGVTAKDMLSNTGNLLQGFGATKRESLEMAEAVNTLASDLASFTNYSGGAKGASEALTKALLGERESAKGLGIAILESDVQVELARKGQQGLTGEALKLAKAQATLEIITRQAKNSIGDYARTSDSASNTLKRAKESTLELKVALGTQLNPAITLAAGLWNRAASALADTIKRRTGVGNLEAATSDLVKTSREYNSVVKTLATDSDTLCVSERGVLEARKDLLASMIQQQAIDLAKAYSEEQKELNKSTKATVEKSKELDILRKRQDELKILSADIGKAWDKLARNEKANYRQLANSSAEYASAAQRDAAAKTIMAQQLSNELKTTQKNILNLNGEYLSASSSLDTFKNKNQELIFSIARAVNNGSISIEQFGNTSNEAYTKFYNDVMAATVAVKGYDEQAKKQAEADAKAAKAAADRAAAQTLADEERSAALEKVSSLLDKEKAEYDKIGEEIKKLSETKFADAKQEEDRIKAIGILRGQQKAIEDEAFEEELEKKQEIWDAEFKARKLIAKGNIEAYKKELEEFKRIADEKKAAYQNMYDGLNATVGVYFDYELARLTENYEYDKQNILDSTMSEEKKAEEIKKLDKNMAIEKAKIARQQAVWDKANTVAQIGMNTAEAITSALTIPPPFGEIASAVVAGLAAAQLGLVVATPLPPIPAFETGGIVPGTSYTGDKMLARVNSGERIYTAEQNAKIDAIFNSLQNGANGGNITVVSVLDGKKVSRSVTRRQRTNNA